MHIDSMSNYSHVDVKGSNSKSGETGRKKKDNGQPSTDLNEDLDNVGFNSKPIKGQVDAILIECQGQDLDMLTSSSDMIGPSNYKPKGTWTCINKMDSARVESHPYLEQ